MSLFFEKFTYNVEKQVLYKANDIIPLKSYQTKLLAFLLSDIDSIHSKEDILNAVWGDQIVSEQVVFQTISQLRTILGAKSIKTFPKKGYKWTLPTSNTSEILFCEESSSAVNSSVESLAPAITKKFNFSVIAVITSFIVLIAMVVQYSIITYEAVNVHGLRNEGGSGHNNNKLIEHALSQSTKFSYNGSVNSTSVSQAFSSPKFAYEKSAVSSTDWLLWGNLYTSSQKAIFHYGLTGKHTHWQGFVEANTAESIVKVMQARLEQLVDLGFFIQREQKLNLNQIKEMLSSAPEDPDLLLLIAKHHKFMDQGDIAISYLKRIISANNMPQFSPYRAAAHLENSKIYKMRGQSLQAFNSLERVSKVLTELPITPLHFQYTKTKAWLEYSETNHEAMFDTLDSAFKYFDDSEIEYPLIRFKLHVLYSILAQKTSEHQKKYEHLSHAQALLMEHELDESNLAIIYYHFALFSRSEKGEELIRNTSVYQKSSVAYLEKILALPRTSDNFWIHDEAFDLLVRGHLERLDLNAAKEIFKGRKLTNRSKFLKGEILIAENNTLDAIELFAEVFEQSKIDYDSRTAIEAAIKLYQFSATKPEMQAEYLAYLESNSNITWLREKLSIAGNRVDN